ncbi:hypothetical protein GIB67_027842 [Kingdonia uniflora]|uniref:Uncharacterized protein n=1 Tax=Kingdonia uniflora TaxID=39325 RepID=A0A7J7P4M4_9MAGN|nr:hypothetical protein GIB67_027842 [Kingdonia uniflora]
MELVQSLIFASTVQGASSTSASNDNTTSEILKVLQNMANSYELDEALFFKGLKLLGGKDEHNYKVIFLGLERVHHLGFLQALLS